ncbi:HAD family phosphatase [Cytophagaceae bacterium DM2B3-1]|uniref:HAD family phosphatase n=1 Tax=Xanthocytophaga flava TaxID=3048013 RepID=A0ABT7CGM5_9BACT|nr:HAD family phosphatase [Xanthocytophaga flavus]MDJ1492865.1 HAD family phosphatase [Xanthocytophaga flavus]
MIQPTAPNLIFDMGGVIIDIDVQLAMVAFAKLVDCDAEELKSRFWGSEFFHAHETGHCSDAEFRSNICALLQKTFPDTDLDQAWNALLLEIPAKRIALLKELRKTHKLYLLSNTNAIHVKAINQLLLEQYELNGMEDLFDKVYYSHQIGKRKPGQEIYTHVLADAGLNAQDCIFFDDLPANLQAAAETGIRTVQIIPGQFTINDYFQGTI